MPASMAHPGGSGRSNARHYRFGLRLIPFPDRAQVALLPKRLQETPYARNLSGTLRSCDSWTISDWIFCSYCLLLKNAEKFLTANFCVQLVKTYLLWPVQHCRGDWASVRLFTRQKTMTNSALKCVHWSFCWLLFSGVTICWKVRTKCQKRFHQILTVISLQD